MEPPSFLFFPESGEIYCGLSWTFSAVILENRRKGKGGNLQKFLMGKVGGEVIAKF